MSSQIFAPQLFDHGSVGAGTSTIELSKGFYHRITLSAASRTIAAPVISAISTVSGQVVDTPDVVRAGSEDVAVGTILFVEIKNASGGVTVITWNSAFAQAATAPTNGNRRLFVFCWDGSKWVQISDGVLVAN